MIQYSVEITDGKGFLFASMLCKTKESAIRYIENMKKIVSTPITFKIVERVVNV